MTKSIWDDSLFINEGTVSSYANTNEKYLQVPVRGIVLEFPGLGGGSCLGGSMTIGDYNSDYAVSFAENGIILAYLFPGPWSWGSCGAVRIGDAVVRALAKKYALGEKPRLAVCGGSMGGMGALIYAADSSLEVCAVASACPCIDCLDRLNSHPDFPRTYISAIASYDMPLEDGLKRISPIYRIGDMPRVPYLICSDSEDEVFPEEQCDGYVAKMKEIGHEVTYHRQPGERHGGFYPEVRQALHDFLTTHISEQK